MAQRIGVLLHSSVPLHAIPCEFRVPWLKELTVKLSHGLYQVMFIDRSDFIKYHNDIILRKIQKGSLVFSLFQQFNSLQVVGKNDRVNLIERNNLFYIT